MTDYSAKRYSLRHLANNVEAVRFYRQPREVLEEAKKLCGKRLRMADHGWLGMSWYLDLDTQSLVSKIITGGQWIVKLDDDTFAVMDDDTFQAVYALQENEE